jgi:hypothetical protein
MLKLIIGICCLISIAALVGCDTSEEGFLEATRPSINEEVVGPSPPPADSYPPAGIPRREAGGLTDWAVHQASSLSDLSASYDTVVVATALKVEVGFPWSPFIAEYFGSVSRAAGETPQPGHPKENLGTPDPSQNLGPVISSYEFQVERVVKSDKLQNGDAIAVSQWGGVVDGVLEEASEDPIMRLDTPYLLFLRLQEDGNYSGPPFARFEIDEGGSVTSVNYPTWGALPAVAAISGNEIDHVISEILAAAATSPSSGN